MDRLARLLSPRSIALLTAAVLLGLACLAFRPGNRHLWGRAGSDQPQHPALAEAAGTGEAAVSPGGTGTNGGLSRFSSDENGTVPIPSTGDQPAPAAQGAVPPGDGRPGPAALRGSPAPVELGPVGAGPLLASPLPTTAGHTAQPAGAAQATAGQPDRASPPLRLPAPPLAPPAARPEALENIARQADQQLYHGFELANRQAYFAARSEFIAALRLVAQGLDAHERTGAHSQSLAAGLTALKEAQDFMPADARLEAELDLPAIVGGHRTPVLKAVPPGQLQALAAVAAYLTFAQERLAAAAGREVAGSMALSALGKLHAALAGQNTPGLQAPEPKAVAFFQAALLVYPRNCIAANELGVLLARNGDYAHARRALEHSVSVGRTALGLRNLALVYRRLGQPQLAELAGRQAEGLAAAEAAAHREFRGSPAGAVRWVEPEVMARTAGQAATR